MNRLVQVECVIQSAGPSLDEMAAGRSSSWGAVTGKPPSWQQHHHVHHHRALLRDRGQEQQQGAGASWWKIQHWLWCACTSTHRAKELCLCSEGEGPEHEPIGTPGAFSKASQHWSSRREGGGGPGAGGGGSKAQRSSQQGKGSPGRPLLGSLLVTSNHKNPHGCTFWLHHLFIFVILTISHDVNCSFNDVSNKAAEVPIKFCC